MAFLECKTSVCMEFRNTSWNNFHLICWILFNPDCLECTFYVPWLSSYLQIFWIMLEHLCFIWKTFWVSILVYRKTEKIWNVFACIKWHILGLLSQCSVQLSSLFVLLFVYDISRSLKCWKLHIWFHICLHD